MKREIVANARKLSRRRFGRLLAGSSMAAAVAAAPRAFSQTPSGARSREELLRAAGTDRLASSAALARFEIPMASEPAFVFRP